MNLFFLMTLIYISMLFYYNTTPVSLEDIIIIRTMIIFDIIYYDDVKIKMADVYNI